MLNFVKFSFFETPCTVQENFRTVKSGLVITSRILSLIRPENATGYDLKGNLCDHKIWLAKKWEPQIQLKFDQLIASSYPLSLMFLRPLPSTKAHYQRGKQEPYWLKYAF